MDAETEKLLKKLEEKVMEAEKWEVVGDILVSLDELKTLTEQSRAAHAKIAEQAAELKVLREHIASQAFDGEALQALKRSADGG